MLIVVGIGASLGTSDILCVQQLRSIDGNVHVVLPDVLTLGFWYQLLPM
jgi:hypothetical protein